MNSPGLSAKEGPIMGSSWMKRAARIRTPRGSYVAHLPARMRAGMLQILTVYAAHGWRSEKSPGGGPGLMCVWCPTGGKGFTSASVPLRHKSRFDLYQFACCSVGRAVRRRTVKHRKKKARQASS